MEVTYLILYTSLYLHSLHITAIDFSVWVSKGGLGGASSNCNKKPFPFLTYSAQKFPILDIRKKRNKPVLPLSQKKSVKVRPSMFYLMWDCGRVIVNVKSNTYRNPCLWPIRWKWPRIPSADTGRMFPSLHLVFILLLSVQQIGLAYSIWAILYLTKIGNKGSCASLIMKK